MFDNLKSTIRVAIAIILLMFGTGMLAASYQPSKGGSGHSRSGDGWYWRGASVDPVRVALGSGLIALAFVTYRRQ